MLTAENLFAKVKAEYKNSIFNETQRWGNPRIQSSNALSDKDVEVRWINTKSKVVTFITNTRKDMSLKIIVKGLKLKDGKPGKTSVEGKEDRFTQTEEQTILLSPGSKATINLDNADAFDVDISEAPSHKEEEQGIIDKVKHIIKRQVTNLKIKIDPNSSNKAPGTGVRG